MEEWKCYGVELKKKGDDVSHASLDEISHSRKTDQNKEAGAQWAYWKKLSMAVNIPFFLTLVIFVECYSSSLVIDFQWWQKEEII